MASPHITTVSEHLPLGVRIGQVVVRQHALALIDTSSSAAINGVNAVAPEMENLGLTPATRSKRDVDHDAPLTGPKFDDSHGTMSVRLKSSSPLPGISATA